MKKINREKQIDIVLTAEQQVMREVGKRIYSMLGRAQQLELIQEKLPKKPIFCPAKTADLLRTYEKRGD